jgi:(R,R)-butanediol dehydrogenase/meso-butanediol dehydrogenase/diacetyl reductase
MRGVFPDGAGGVEVREFAPGAVPPGWVSVDVAYNGICGSDLHSIASAPAGADIALGHEIVGFLGGDTPTLSRGTAVFVNPVQRCGACPPCLSGRTTFCFAMQSLGGTSSGGMAERVLVPATEVFEIPAGVEMRRAALLEPLANCVHAVRAAGLRGGDTVHVIGAGPIGIIIALLAQRLGAASVTISEPTVGRRALAEELGIETTAADRGDMSASVVFEASGHPSVPAGLTSWAAAGGTVAVVGMYPPGLHGTDLFDLALRELRMLGSLTYDRGDIKAAIGHIGDLPLERLVTDVVPLEGVGQAVDRLRDGTAMKILVSA